MREGTETITERNDTISYALGFLPYRIRRSALEYFDSSPDCEKGLTEIRLRCGRPSSLTSGGKNIALPDSAMTPGEMRETLGSMCGGSVYAHSATIREGYIALLCGVRVGVCGSAVSEKADGGENIEAVNAVTSLCVRIPEDIRGVGREIFALVEKTGRGALIYSPPGVGKTTLLRSLCHMFAEKKRVAVVDTRRELIPEDSGDGFIDVLRSYPRGKGIEIAARTMSPEIIICDEIGNYEEAVMIASVAGCGVPLIASAHAENLEALLKRRGIRLLHEACVFGYYAGITREPGERDYKYAITPREAVGA